MQNHKNELMVRGTNNLTLARLSVKFNVVLDFYLFFFWHDEHRINKLINFGLSDLQVGFC